MKKSCASRYKTFIAFYAGLTLSACSTPHSAELAVQSAASSEHVPAGYNLIWADEFDVEGLPDPAKWSYDTYRNKEGWWNEETQYYAASRSENARIENGYLIIEARKDGAQLRGYPDYAKQLSGYPDYGGQDYSSARLYTKGKASWTYGYFEIRAKLPCGRGLWPAIWALPEEPGNWPDSGEIDIMEYVGHAPKTFHATLHTRDNNHIKKTEIGKKLTVKTACKAFHTHSLLWTPNAITIAVDGRPYLKHEYDSQSDENWPFNRPYHLILNMAIGGTWAGRQGIDAKAFPARMEVDYVRVYQAE